MNKFWISLLLLLLVYLSVPVFGYELDTSVNSEIEQKYNSNKLNEDMQVNSNNSVKSSLKKAPKSSPVFDNTSVNITKSNKNTSSAEVKNTKYNLKLPSGTKFNVKSSVAVSGWSGVNSLLSFRSTESVYKNGVTIPAGTVFKGVVSASHQGQITGNGGLIKIKITSMNYKGKTYNVEGKITKANSKKIFFNKIKGTRQYITGVNNQIKKGINFYKNAKNLSSKLSSNPVGTILSPIPILTGAVGGTAYSALSPITGLIQKGKNITLPSGTVYEIKITQDVYLE